MFPLLEDNPDKTGLRLKFVSSPNPRQWLRQLTCLTNDFVGSV